MSGPRPATIFPSWRKNRYPPPSGGPGGGPGPAEQIAIEADGCGDIGRAEVDPGRGTGGVVGHGPDAPSGRGVWQVPSHDRNNQAPPEPAAPLVGVQVDPRHERGAGARAEPDVGADQQVAAFIGEAVV